MKQSKKHSLIESIANVVVGLVISFLIQLIIYPALNIKVSLNKFFPSLVIKSPKRNAPS